MVTGLVSGSFGSKRLRGELLELRNRSGTRRDSPISLGFKRWKHCSRQGATECKMLSSEMDMCYIRVIMEAIFEDTLRDLIVSLLVRIAHPKIHEDCAPESMSIQLVDLQCQFDNLVFCGAHEN